MSTVKTLIHAGDAIALKGYLEENSGKVHEPIPWGCTPCNTEPLHYLADGFFNGFWEHGKEAALAQVLIDAGAPVDGRPDSGETPLHGAASLGCTAVAGVLIERGANFEAVASYPGIEHGTPLEFAVHFGMVGVVDLLVARGAVIHSARMAAGSGNLDLLKRHGETLGSKFDDRKSQVYRCAAICGRTRVVDYLLANGIDVNHAIESATAMHWAAWESKPDMVRHLLDCGADPNRLDKKYSMTPLGWARHRMAEIGPQWHHDRVIDILDPVTQA